MNHRTCLQTRKKYEASELIRFVLSPEGRIMADINKKLPGRGAYLSPSRAIIEAAAEKQLLQRYFHSKSGVDFKDISIDADLAKQIDNLLVNKAIAALSLGRKSGNVIFGAFKAIEAVKKGKVHSILHATEASKDSIRKITNAIYGAKQIYGRDIAQYSLFTADELANIGSDENIVHVAILENQNIKHIIAQLDRLHIYRG